MTLSSGLGAKTCPGIFHLGQPTKIIRGCCCQLGCPTSICRKALSFTVVIFTRLLSYTCTPRSGRPSHVYHRFGRRHSFLPFIYPFPNFYRESKCEIWPRSSTALLFAQPSFRNEATRYQSIIFGVAMMELCSFPNLVQFGPPPLISRV